MNGTRTAAMSSAKAQAPIWGVMIFAPQMTRAMAPTFKRTEARGRLGGWLGGRPIVMTDERIEVARRMRAEKATWATIAQTLQVGVSSVRRALADGADQHESKETR